MTSRSRRRGSRLRATLGLALVLGTALECAAQSSDDDILVVLGAQSGSWSTQFVLANSTDAPVLANIGLNPEIQTTCVVCPVETTIQLPGKGTGSTGFVGPGGLVVYVRAVTGPAPSTSARVFNGADLSKSVDLPIFRLSTLLALNPSQLTFGLRPQFIRTNLLLANIRGLSVDATDVSLRIEILDGDGRSLGMRDLNLPAMQAAYIVNVASFLGIENPSNGQVRVIRTAGTGKFWGISPAVSADGAISISLGSMP